MKHIENLLAVALGVGTIVGSVMVGCGGDTPASQTGGNGASSVGGDGSGGNPSTSSSSSGNLGGSAGSGGTAGSGGAGVCSTPADCSDGFSCTIDTCNGGMCEHTVGPNSGATACPAGKICQLGQGCTDDIIICADDAQCIDKLGADPCNANIHCELATSVCAYSTLDKDTDGQAPIVCGGMDCDDSTSQTYAGAMEICDGKDNNCNGTTDENAMCPGLSVCQAGACMCPPQNACGIECVDKMTNNMHCGTCNTPCPGVANCMNGQCVCPGGSTTCGSICVDTKTDPLHCGGCGKMCAPGYSCVNSLCTCLDTPCGTACINTMNDPLNCGGCNVQCPAGLACQNGMCQCPMGQTLCGGQCVNTMTSTTHCGGCNIPCPVGGSCTNGLCGCPIGQTACLGQCVNTMTNTSHCGGCNIPCAVGASCQNGSCMCPAGQSACGGQCVDILMNTNHCGGCNKPCNGICQNGACTQCSVANLYLFTDRSGSLTTTVPSGVTRQDAIRNGINAFMSNASSANMGVGIGYHPVTGTGTVKECLLTQTPCMTDADCSMFPFPQTCVPVGAADSCVDADYQTPAVGIALLPGNQSAISNSLAAQSANGGSMPPPGYRGALQYAKNYAMANSTQKVAVVLISDNLPNICATTVDSPSDLIPIAQQFANGTPKVITYVIGISDGISPNPTQAQWNQVATAGGTSSAYLANSTADVTNALNSIRAQFKTCP
jgi:hypothetical protein